METAKQHDIPVTSGPGDNVTPFWPHLFEPFRHAASHLPTFFSPSVHPSRGAHRPD